MRQEVIESVLDSFEDQHLNLTMIQEYERMAKTHLSIYLEALENKVKKLPEDQHSLLTGIVHKTARRQGFERLYPLFTTVAMNELLCLKNAGAQISLFFTSYE